MIARLTPFLASLFLAAVCNGQQPALFVVLPSSEARSMWKGSWQPSKADIDGLEASLSQLRERALPFRRRP